MKKGSVMDPTPDSCLDKEKFNTKYRKGALFHMAPSIQ